MIHFIQVFILNYNILKKITIIKQKGCKREITLENGRIKIQGSDNIDGSNQWTLYAKLNSNGNYN